MDANFWMEFHQRSQQQQKKNNMINHIMGQIGDLFIRDNNMIHVTYVNICILNNTLCININMLNWLSSFNILFSSTLQGSILLIKLCDEIQISVFQIILHPFVYSCVELRRKMVLPITRFTFTKNVMKCIIVMEKVTAHHCEWIDRRDSWNSTICNARNWRICLWRICRCANVQPFGWVDVRWDIYPGNVQSFGFHLSNPVKR